MDRFNFTSDSEGHSFLAYQMDISGVLTRSRKVFTRGTDSWHAQFDAGLLCCDKGQLFIKIMVFTNYGCNL